VPLRDHCIVFNRAPLEQSAKVIPELASVLPLLDRASHGAEFFGISDLALTHFKRVKEKQHVARFSALLEFLDALARCEDYRL